MLIKEFLEQELEELEQAIELASDPERPAISLVPKFQAQKEFILTLLRKAEGKENENSRIVDDSTEKVSTRGRSLGI